MRTKKQIVVANAFFKIIDASGKFIFLPGTKQFPIRAAKREQRDNAVDAFVNRVVRKGKYYAPHIWCFISDAQDSSRT